MDLLDRLLGHDAWTTRQLLLRCRGLKDEDLDRRFDIGHETLRGTLVHLIGNMEVWTDLLYERPVRSGAELLAAARSVDGLIARLDAVAPDFAALARRVRDEGATTRSGPTSSTTRRRRRPTGARSPIC